MKAIVQAILIGVLAAGLVAGVTQPLLLGELGGPIDFTLPLLILSNLALVPTVLLCKPMGWRHGIFTGLGFSIPIAVTCFTLPMDDPAHLDRHAGQLRVVGVGMVLLSGIVMAVRATTRQ